MFILIDVSPNKSLRKHTKKSRSKVPYKMQKNTGFGF